MRLKKAWKKFWWFIWDDDSAASWIANIVLAFVLIKFIVYPGLGLAFGTTHPVVAVVSGSMEHSDSFENWWMYQCPKGKQEEMYIPYQIDSEQFKTYPFNDGFNKGDIMVIWGHSDVNVGDVIVYQTQYRFEPIIHRVIQTTHQDEHQLYKTKGDNNCGIAKFEENIRDDNILGKAVLRIPYLGWVKLGFVGLVETIW